MITLLIIAEVLLLLDWRQTITIVKNPLTHSESNIILGKHPSVASVNVYFFICMIGLAGLYYGSPELGIWITGVIVALETYVILHNRNNFGKWFY